jgi:hypothetical protein
MGVTSSGNIEDKEIGTGSAAVVSYENDIEKEVMDGETTSTVEVEVVDSTACREESLQSLLKALHDEPEEKGVRPLTFQTNITGETHSNCTFSGLNSQLIDCAFRGKRIALVGDSTLQVFTKSLIALIVTTIRAREIDGSSISDPYLKNLIGRKKDIPNSNVIYTDLSTMPLSNATSLLWSTAVYKSYHETVTWLTDNFSYRNEDDDIWIQYHSSPEPFWNQSETMTPQILVINEGLHWLHFMGEGRDMNNKEFLSFWVHYETWLLGHLQNAINHNRKLKNTSNNDKTIQVMLFKTTNRICDSHFLDEYARAAHLYSVNDADTLSKCREMIARINLKGTTINSNITSSDIANYCENATMTEAGVVHLNERLYKFVERQKQQLQEELEETGLKVAIVPDHDVQSCPFTYQGDGRHYARLNVMRIRLYANILESMIR